MKNVLVIGSAGFIGFHTSSLFCKKNFNVVGIDNFDGYYDLKLKKDRIKQLKKEFQNYIFEKIDIKNKNNLKKIFSKYNFTTVINLAAQPGIRASIVNPQKVFDNNVMGFFNILNLVKEFNINHFILASTSSVYGNLDQSSYKEEDLINTPLQMYSASKITNEVMAHSYSNIYNIKTTCLRFFTVYGPWGRPDMSYFKFVNNILNGKEIELYNFGNHHRDFTYVDDIVQGIFNSNRYMPKFLQKNISKKMIPFEILNLGNTKSISLKKFVKIIEKNLQIKAKILLVEKQDGDMFKTKSNIQKATNLIKYLPKTDFDKGINIFVKWYKDYYSHK